MNTIPCLLFVNLRRIQREALASIYAAHELGYKIILLTNSIPRDYLKNMFIHIEYVDTYNYERSVRTALSLARMYNIKAIPSFTEIDIELVALICEALNLPGLTPVAAQRSRNKYAMKKALSTYPNLLPKYELVRTYKDMQFAIEKIGYPAILKPTGASGSSGIFELRNQHDLLKSFQELQKIAQPSFDAVFRQYGSEFIMEEYLDGHEFSVEGLIHNKNIYIIGVTDKWTTTQFHIEYQHIFPSCLSADAIDDIKEKTVLICKTIGLNYCAFHLEAKWTSNGFRFIEIAARPAGGNIGTHIIFPATKINLFRELINISLDHQPKLTSNKFLCSGIRFILAKNAGTLHYFDGLDLALCNPNVDQILIDVPIGSKIELPPQNFRLLRTAAVVVNHKEYNQCQFILNHLGENIIPQIK